MRLKFRYQFTVTALVGNLRSDTLRTRIIVSDALPELSVQDVTSEQGHVRLIATVCRQTGFRFEWESQTVDGWNKKLSHIFSQCVMKK